MGLPYARASVPAHRPEREDEVPGGDRHPVAPVRVRTDAIRDRERPRRRVGGGRELRPIHVPSNLVRRLEDGGRDPGEQRHRRVATDVEHVQARRLCDRPAEDDRAAALRRLRRTRRPLPRRREARRRAPRRGLAVEPPVLRVHEGIERRRGEVPQLATPLPPTAAARRAAAPERPSPSARPRGSAQCACRLGSRIRCA